MKYRKKTTSSLLRTSAPNLYMTALKYFQEKDFPKAILLFEELLKHPLIKVNNYLQAILLFNIALCFQKNKDFSQAAKLYCRSCAKGIGRRGWSAIIWLLSQQDISLGSQERQVIKQIIDSSNIDSLGYSAMLSHMAGKNQEALRKFSSAASQLPSPFNVVNLGLICKEQQRCDLLRDYKKILTFIARIQNQLGEKAWQVLRFIQQSSNLPSSKKNQIKVRNISRSVGRGEKREGDIQGLNKLLLDEQTRYKKKISFGTNVQELPIRSQSKRVSFAEQSSFKIAQLKTGAQLQSVQQMAKDQEIQRSYFQIPQPYSSQQASQLESSLFVKAKPVEQFAKPTQPLSVHIETDTQSSLKCQRTLGNQIFRTAPEQAHWQKGWRLVEEGQVQKGFEQLQKGLQYWLLQKVRFKQEIIKFIKLLIYFRRRTDHFQFVVLAGLHSCLDQGVYQELHLKVQLLIVCQQFFQASALIQAHIHKFPELNYLMSDLLEEQGSISQSIRAMQNYLKEGGSKSDLLKLCRLLVKAGRIDEASQISKKMSPDQQTLALRLMIAQHRDDKQECLRLKSELNLLQGSAHHFNHIVQLFKAGMTQEAQKYVQIVCQQLKKQELLFVKSYLENAHGRHRRAFHYLAQIQDDHSVQVDFFNLHKADVLFRLKKYQQSKALYLRTEHRQQLSVESCTNLAICYFHTRKYQSAQTIFLRLIQSNQTSFQIRYNLGCVQFALNKVEQAQRNFQMALELNQRDANSQYCLLVCRYLLGKQLHALHSIAQLDSGRFKSCSEYLKNNFKPVGVTGFQD